ncbi:irregular chiasm roughest protein [Echinococcus multilocularis]|uniref:Irregular chiasm roughest protein n=1 Tax=Echinococcus multilocularis TaxID=6211 RepID=A0A068XTS9_ECHMU|nr:irregular chiasm roughest protein [Echinococcus multilocularis]
MAAAVAGTGAVAAKSLNRFPADTTSFTSHIHLSLISGPVNRFMLPLPFLHYIALYILLIMVPRVRTDDSGDYFVQQPVSQSVTLNSTFTLACRLRVSLFQDTSPPGHQTQKATVQWIRNKFGLGTTREDIQQAGMEANSLRSRYDLPYNLDEGQYDLQIRQAKSLDEGQYVCQLRYNQETKFSQTADVRVLVASEAPTLVQLGIDNDEDMRRVGPQVAATATEGSYLRLLCIAKNGKPGAKLFWTLNGSPLMIVHNEDGTKGKITSHIEGNVSIKSISAPQPPFLVTTVSEIIVYATKLHHGSNIQCRAQNEGYENQPLQPAFTKLNIHYAPVVKMRVSSTTSQRNLLENDVVTIRCSAEGRPDNFTWSWMMNGSVIEGERSEQYRIRLSRDLINLTVACVAATFAEGSDQTILTFHYAPQFINPNPVIYAGALGEPLRMHCAVDGNPRPEVEWPLVARGEVFARDRIHEGDFGTYVCTARSLGFSVVSKKVILAKKSAPRIKSAEPVYAAIGAAARLPCTINAIPLPPPGGLLWRRRDIVLGPSSHRKFSTQEFLGGVVFVMSFTHVMPTDFGFYNCSAVNAYGSDSQTMELRRDDEISISSLSGILAALVAAVLMALLLFFCCRRRQYRKTRLKGSVLPTTSSKRKPYLMDEPGGYTHTNNLPHLMKLDSKDDAFYRHSSSGSTEGETFDRYQFPSAAVRSSSALGNAQVRPPANGSAAIADRYVSMRPFSPVCKYTLIDGNGQQIPVCTNVVTFASHPGDGNGTTLCLASDYQPIPINYVNLPVTEEAPSPTSLERVTVVTAPDLPPDSDIIVNTQVTHV